MSRVFWDSMLLIYLVEDHPDFGGLVRDVVTRCFQREDVLLTSHLSLAETLVGIPEGSDKEVLFFETIKEIGFELVSFEAKSVAPFRRLRQGFGLKPPDSLNLACAAAAGTDIYLTGDQQLLKKRIHVPGIQFIADFTNAPL